MSELHKFLFQDLPVRGAVVRLTDAWVEILQRHSLGTGQAYPEPVQRLLGELAAAATLMRSSIKFNGSLTLQIVGDGPVKLVVAQVQPDLGLRATATVSGEVGADAGLSALVNAANTGRCAITLDPQSALPGQNPYQGVVPLHGPRGEKLDRLSEVLEQYMLQSEQLETTLVLAADDKVAAGLLLQRLPGQGGQAEPDATKSDSMGHNEDYNRLAMLGASLKRDELLTLDVATILRRLFWEETLVLFEPLVGEAGPRFSCTCGRERVSKMIFGLGEPEANSILAERGGIEVACEFCGTKERFDAVDVARIFAGQGAVPPPESTLH